MRWYFFHQMYEEANDLRANIARLYVRLKSRRTKRAQQLHAKLQRSVIVCKLSECFRDWKVLSLLI